MTEIVSHVDAVWGGRPVRFELYRDRATVQAFERALGSANAAWGRFVSGSYTLSDVRAVLALSHPAVPYERLPVPGVSVQEAGATLRMLARAERAPPAPVALPPRIARGVDPERLDGILSGRPLATYAALAELVLTAWLIGLPEILSRFDEARSLDGALAAYIAERARPAETGEAAA